MIAGRVDQYGPLPRSFDHTCKVDLVGISSMSRTMTTLKKFMMQRLPTIMGLGRPWKLATKSSILIALVKQPRFSRET